MKRIYYPLEQGEIIWAGTEGEPMGFTVDSIEVIEGKPGCEDWIVAHLRPVVFAPEIQRR